MTGPLLERNAVCAAEFLHAAMQSSAGAPCGFKLPLNDAQAALASEVQCRERCSISKLHNFAFSLFAKSTEELRVDTYRCPLQYFLAGYHLHADGRFSTAHEVLPHVSELVHLVSVVVLYEALTSEDVISAYFSVLNHRARYLEGQCTFGLLRDLQMAASRVAWTTLRAPAIAWTKTFSQLTCAERCIDLSRMRAGLRFALEDTEALASVLVGGKTVPFTHAEPMVDDPSNLRAHHSFVDALRPPLSKNTLFKAAVEESSASLVYVDAKGDIQVNAACAMMFMSKARDLNHHLLVLSFFLGGQPFGAVDLLDCQVRNTLRPRNLHYVHGHIYLNMERPAGNGIGSHWAPHKLPKALTDHMLWYLCCVRPIETWLARRLWGAGAERTYHEMLFVDLGNAVDRTALERAVVAFGVQYWGAGLPLDAQMEVLSAVKHEFVAPRLLKMGGGWSAHSWLECASDRLWRPPVDAHASTACLSADALATFSDVADEWHTLLLSERDDRMPLPLRYRPLAHTGTVEAEVRRGAPDIEVRPPESAVVSTLQSSRPLDRAEVPSPRSTAGSEGRASDAVECTPRVDNECWEKLALERVRKAFGGATASFRSPGQCDLLVHSYFGHGHCIAVLPSGGGKSLSFLVPSFPPEEKSMYVVVVPSDAAAKQIASRARTLRQSCIVWSPKCDVSCARNPVVLATVQHVSSDPAFERFLQANEVYVRVVFFDDCHLFLTSPKYGAIFGKDGEGEPKKIAQLSECSYVYLTATLPVAQESRFRGAVRLRDGSHRVRTHTDQLSVVYHTVRVSGKARVCDVAVQVARRAASACASSGRKVLVFAQTNDAAVTVSSALGCPHYGGQAEQGAVLEEWLNGTHSMLVAILSEMQGIKVPHVDAVVFCSLPSGMIEFLQGCGCREHGARRMDAVVVCRAPPESLVHSLEHIQRARPEMYSWVSDVSGCLRTKIALCMDGRKIDCNDLRGLGGLPCARCAPDDLTTRHITDLDGSSCSLAADAPKVQFACFLSPSHASDSARRFQTLFSARVRRHIGMTSWRGCPR